MTPLSSALNGDNQNERRFEFYLSLKSKSGEFIANHILQKHIQPTENRRKKRRPNDLKKLQTVLSTTIANIILLRKSQATQLYYPRSKRHYSNIQYGYYIPKAFGFDIFISALKGMEDAGLIIETIGSNQLSDSARRQSSLRPTESLYDCIDKLGLSETDVIFNELAAPVIILKDKEKIKQSISLSNPAISKMDREIRAINQHINRYQIRLPSQSLSDRGRQKINTDAFRPVRLIRIFNNSSLQEGGRFYHGPWQQIVSALRPDLTIDNAKTRELDYSGFMTRAIYHHCGLEYVEDPYAIPDAANLLKDLGATDENEIRSIIKYQVNCMISSSSTYRIPNPERIGIFEDRPIGDEQLLKLRKAIRDFHHPVCEYFSSGRGLEFQFIESEICNQILLSSIEAKIPVLPIHDSFITTERYEDWLHQTMLSAYQDELKFKPTIH